VAWRVYQERIRKQQVRIQDVPQEIVSNAERQVKPVVAVRRQHGQIPLPTLAIMEPGQILNIADLESSHATDRIGRLLRHRLQVDQQVKRVHIGCIDNSVRQLQQRVRQSARIGTGRQQGRLPKKLSPCQYERLRHDGEADASPVGQLLCQRRPRSVRHDGQATRIPVDSIRGCLDDVDVRVGKHIGQLAERPGDRPGHCHLVGSVPHQKNAPRLACHSAAAPR
jgi:hypothetical protein